MISIDIEKKLEELKDTFLCNNSIFTYAAGSIFEGFGNAKSDIDIFIVYKDIENIVNQNNDKIEGEFIDKDELKSVYSFKKDGMRYDCEMYLVEDAENIINTINGVSYKTDVLFKFIPEEYIDFLHRLKYARVISGREEFINFYSKVDFNKLCYYLSMHYSQIQTGIIEDIEGCLNSKDYGTAYFNARSLLNYSIKAFLAAHGETNPKDKWTYRKLKRFSEQFGSNYYLNTFMELQTAKFESLYSKHYRDIINFCHELNSKTQNLICSFQKI